MAIIVWRSFAVIVWLMNKGIRMAKGEYLQFLNSGDMLAAPDVTEKMLKELENKKQRIKNKDKIAILYGNMLKQMRKGILRDPGFAGRQPTLLDFYIGTLNHSPAYIECSLFDKYGLYDEQLKIASDWKWYLQAIIFGGEQITYADIDVTMFDMNGISTINETLDKEERQQVLQSLLPPAILKDYEKHELKDRSYNFCFIIKQSDKNLRLSIDFEDPDTINEVCYQWCDIYGKVNTNWQQTPSDQYPKLVSLAPGFGIRVWNLAKTLQLALSNTLKSNLNLTESRKLIGKYKRQYSLRLPISYYQPQSYTEKQPYIYHLSTLWYSDEWNQNDKGVNLTRANFVRA